MAAMPEPPQTWEEARPLLRSILRPSTYASLRRSGEAVDPVRLLPFVAAELADYLRRIAPREEWRVERVRLPWERLFEVDFELAPANR